MNKEGISGYSDKGHKIRVARACTRATYDLSDPPKDLEQTHCNTNSVRRRLPCDKESSHFVGPSLPLAMEQSVGISQRK